MKNYIIIKKYFLFLVFLPLSCITLLAQEQKVLLAGASMSNITPDLGSGIVGNFGGNPPAQYIHDELHAKTLVLDNGEKRIAFVVVDNISIAREVFDEAKRNIFQETKIAPENILMSTTHTHSSVSGTWTGSRRHWWNEGLPFDKYQLFLIKRITDAVRNAVTNLEPAKIAWGVGSVPQHVYNRRWIMKEKVRSPFGGYEKVKMNPGFNNDNKLKPAGPTDPDVAFISVQSLDGRPISIFANYSTHYAGGVPKNDISADYFSVFADRIQQLIGADRQFPHFVGIMSNGTSGDINTVNYGGVQRRYEPYEKMKVVAEDLAQEVYRVYKDLEYRTWIPLDAIQKEVRLKTRTSTEKQIARAKQVLKRPKDKEYWHVHERSYANRLLRMEAEYPRDINIILQAYRIGDLGVSSLPFEVFAETGLELKKKSPFKTTFTIGLANGSYGYLPPPEQHKLGGYETWIGTSKVQEDATVILVDELVKMFIEIK
ncbi:hypothetical protein G5B00_17765 [Parapedobacter sp. SGR-10]|uniref:neutral/alkaline non-lysosomal ceramidase N-terminal domain-containing protein n=1 Tax=Parapedobacter sp. SGR-10 TaxID=2710879 RepID=UPI0013D0B3A2|nr:neutral/alkaline non-lysosomal ceramidase N-terminal domain-containing protein [Parapedobacter sp. SGR-10]NGF58347.1 hypothetical protein [Parapedobacter sp. SGR-10]